MYMNGLKRKVCVAVLCVFAAAAVLYAHTPLLTVEDNGDGTIFVQGGFSNGASAGGVKLYLKDAATGEKLYDGVFPDIGETNLDIPSVPYTVTFDAGPGHIVVKDGPPPPGGFGAAKADKALVQKYVALLLGLKEIPRPDHAADALAAAITHIHSVR